MSQLPFVKAQPFAQGGYPSQSHLHQGVHQAVISAAPRKIATSKERDSCYRPLQKHSVDPFDHPARGEGRASGSADPT
jgi:hypothetical protein